MERLDSSVGLDAKDRGVMLELLSFMYLSPDLYTCLQVPGESPEFQERLILVPSTPGPYSDLDFLIRPFP